MNMPPLPEASPAGYIAQTEYFYTQEQMQAYGKACRDAALEEAARLCNGEQWMMSGKKSVNYITAFNEGCEDCEAHY